MNVGSHRLARLAKRLWRRPVPGTLVLLYHRVIDLPSDPFGLAVSPAHFAEQLEVLCRLARPTPLRKLASRRGIGMPLRSVVVTFDDGYADNLLAARPVLETYDVPATVFVTSGCVGREGEFWWDELEGILLRPGILPDALTLEYAGGTFHGELGEATAYPEVSFDLHRRWTFGDDDVPTPRHRLYCRLYRLLQGMPPEHQDHAIEDLRVWADVAPLARPEYRTLTTRELAQLAEGSLIEVGAHTRSHPMLPILAESSQKDEILEGKGRLEQILGRQVGSFAYPYGSHTAETVAAVQDSGFTTAFTTRAAPARRSDPPFEMPRLWVGNWDGDEFARHLRSWIST